MDRFAETIDRPRAGAASVAALEKQTGSVLQAAKKAPTTAQEAEVRPGHETSHETECTATATPAKRPAGPGTPRKHDWDAFAGAIARRAHDHGMSVSQGELVRDMMEWFAGREDFLALDERTVRRKVAAIWKELNGHHA